MKNIAWKFEAFGMNHLKVYEEEVPEIQDDELLLEIKAVSLNYRDLLMIKGEYNPKLNLPMVPCSDGLGVVVKVGNNVKEFKEGDRVLPIITQGWHDGKLFREIHRRTLGGPLPGVLQKYFVVKASEVVPAPKNLTDVEASTLPVAALTAWSALFEFGKPIPGQTLLTLGTGGVSIFALQFGKLLGLKVIITSSSNEKLERARRLGADYTINYQQNPDWEKEVQAITNSKGVDYVIEVGGVGTLEKSLRSVKSNGVVFLIGVLAGKKAPIDLTSVLMQNITIQGVFAGHKRSFVEMNQVFDTFSIKPVVDKVFPFEESPKAFEYMASGSHFGKVCISLS
ncbi:MAG: NAD(P)-dependent alcohol dehydrogenase [Leptospiraceae bacterium]|nr:NAD(P)-dependent alcohol dehydrogenase [Leptospiraceae bacterium]MDW7975425.1 NAD(P)-dependent alcohol dehydrogenase [Leptospiraceae bacterium]